MGRICKITDFGLALIRDKYQYLYCTAIRKVIIKAPLCTVLLWPCSLFRGVTAGNVWWGCGLLREPNPIQFEMKLIYCFALFYFRPVPKLKFRPYFISLFCTIHTRLIRVSSFQKMLCFESPEIWRRVFNSRFYSKFLKKLIITKSDNNSNCTVSIYFSTQRVQVLLFFRPLIADQKGLTTEAVSKYDIHHKGWK